MDKIIHFFLLVFIIFIIGCDNDTIPENNNLIGYWRSENTYQMTIESIASDMCIIYIFERNRIYNFLISESYLQYIKTMEIKDEDWKPYSINNEKIIIDYGNIEGFQINIEIPYYFAGEKLVMTLPESMVDSIGLKTQIITFTKIP